MRRSLLRGVAALTMTCSLAVLMTAIQPTPVHAQTSDPGSSGTVSMGVFICSGNPFAGTCGGPCLIGGPCRGQKIGPNWKCDC